MRVISVGFGLCLIAGCGVKQETMDLKKTPGHVERPVNEISKKIVKATLTNGDKNVETESKAVNKVVTDSGLMYETLTAAPQGAVSPSRTQQVKVHYTGWLADDEGQPIVSKKFDSSVDRNDPFVFPVGVGMVIKGWDEGVLMMKVGEKARLTLPSDIAYGARGAGSSIPPHATLVFDVELLEIVS